MEKEVTSLPAIQIANFAVNQPGINSMPVKTRTVLRDSLTEMIQDLCSDKLKEYHQRLNEVIETTGQLTKEDLQLCLGYTCESLLNQIEK